MIDEDEFKDFKIIDQEDMLEIDLELLERFRSFKGPLSYDNPDAYDFYFKVDIYWLYF